MTTTSPALGPLVAVYGLVGHDERLLVVRDSDAITYRLPGGFVRAGEAVEDALRRILREQVDAHAAHLDFCAAVELRNQHPGTQPTVFELALLFDVTLIDPSAVRVDHGEARWATDTELDHLDLRPTALADRLRNGGPTREQPWWPARS
ncbi:ADP-ribose pyrophosphatase YjhB, NUDIX family [Amycolatopsis marina]|uniref:ADP-ribose pyrophosphatase YjhB, NUDIX family n=1 Tax=Amycolatopsis marina TaxID=490629 RepID=A0A1I1BHX0_9PSEU|nr:NUDIX domain-containing protein [Amycolatopsis marina]SFB49226.1 ADP-ribose pyrophosphatase YjhB, NUDIX family [Amycolatopsis marina]